MCITNSAVDSKLKQASLLPALTAIVLILLEICNISTHKFGTHIWTFELILAFFAFLYTVIKTSNVNSNFARVAKIWAYFMILFMAGRVISEVIHTNSEYDAKNWSSYLKFTVDALFYSGFLFIWVAFKQTI